MLRSRFYRGLLFIDSILLLSSCFSPIDGGETIESQDNNVTIRFVTWRQEDFTRADVPLSDAATRLSVAVFLDGTKTRTVTQKAGDDDFGIVSLPLAEGSYDVVAVAHNSAEGNATLTSTQKVTFASNKVSDTFSHCGTLTVSDGEPMTETIALNRVVAMVRFTLTSPLPSGIDRLKFYYTGGSSTLDPSAGFGCVNSKQTEYRSAVADGSPVTTFEIYTIPHEENDVLKIVITAQDSTGDDLAEWTMENVPVSRNKITTWEGTLGSGGGSVTDGNITVTVNTDWLGTQEYKF